LSMVALFLVGFLFFSETYTYMQTLGIILTITGIFILFSDPMQKLE